MISQVAGTESSPATGAQFTLPEWLILEPDYVNILSQGPNLIIDGVQEFIDSGSASGFEDWFRNPSYYIKKFAFKLNIGALAGRYTPLEFGIEEWKSIDDLKANSYYSSLSFLQLNWADFVTADITES